MLWLTGDEGIVEVKGLVWIFILHDVLCDAIACLQIVLSVSCL